MYHVRISALNCAGCRALALPQVPAHLPAAPLAPAQERQREQRCLQHALNNLLQAPRFTPAELDAVADTLGGLAARNSSWVPWMRGNWDANVLMAALAPLALVRTARQRRCQQLDWGPTLEGGRARRSQPAAQSRGQGLGRTRVPCSRGPGRCQRAVALPGADAAR